MPSNYAWMGLGSTVGRHGDDAAWLDQVRGPDDPKGRFSRYNFPGHVDRETAIDLVLNTPKAGEPLPIST